MHKAFVPFLPFLSPLSPLSPFFPHCVLKSEDEGTLQNNYYTACNVGGVANATKVGCSQYEGSYLEQSDPDGAKPALLDNVDNTAAIAAIDALSKNITYSVCINGRTLYKDGT